MDTTGPLDVFPARVQHIPFSEAFTAVKTACQDGSWKTPCEEGRILPFYAASRASEQEAVTLWLYIMTHVANYPTEHLDVYGQTPIFYAAREGHLNLLKLMATGTHVEPSLLEQAGAQDPKIQALVDKLKAADETTADDSDHDHGAAKAEPKAETKAETRSEKAKPGALPLFDPGYLDSTSQTALFYACREGHNEIIRYLVTDRRVPVNHIDLNGDTALFYAARDNREATCKLMVEFGADCGFRNKSKYYASTVAKKMGHKRLATYLEQCRKTQPKPQAATHERATHERATHERATHERATHERATHERATHRETHAVATKAANTTKAAVASDSEDAAAASASASATSPATASVEKKRARPQRGKRKHSEEQEPEPVRASPKRRAVKQQPVPVAEDRDLCCLQFMSPLKTWSHTPQFKVQEFESIFPELAVWDGMGSAAAKSLEGDNQRSQWHRLATDVMRHLCHEVENAHFFREPVDTDRWNIPDYHEVVKEPMDFGTILTNLEVGVQYLTIHDFLRDLNLVFDNCILYNGGDSNIGKIAQSVRETAYAYARSIGLQDLADKEAGGGKPRRQGGGLTTS
ncbi:bromodomain protein [Gregarina niphandrodes]|uniref:Bromodomain protein n=1 Tax=Gregarina niphandrodes TaxID=110365 RepID=A0A023B0H4_GRENI|nr:bromodomain protein [Gregarina niphandrodes]EZG44984.1 bromodomain protein [Gregarina niphandrodes]|eukprot:XP_011132610.1 bromodomain protein [Gregarina niphandrodes]